MLLITDRAKDSGPLERVLALWGPCAVIDLNDLAHDGYRSKRLVVSDVDISSSASVEALRTALARRRDRGTPYLCLLRSETARATLQANALGASGVLAAGASARVLLDKISQMLLAATGDDKPAASIQHHFVAASAALADLLAAAGRGEALPVAAINESVASINRAADETDIGGWLEMVWNHDDLTYQHCLLVAGLAAAFARQLGFPDEARKLMTGAALLHDIGKAKIPLDILHKAGKLTPAETSIMRTHPQLGYEMLQSQGGFASAMVEAVHRHHEYLDGSGYPQGLRGEDISDVVRMITICDIYAALIEWRSYKAPMRPEAAYATLRGMGGKLDADLLRAFKAVVFAETVCHPRAISA